MIYKPLIKITRYIISNVVQMSKHWTLIYVFFEKLKQPTQTFFNYLRETLVWLRPLSCGIKVQIQCADRQNPELVSVNCLSSESKTSMLSPCWIWWQMFKQMKYNAHRVVEVVIYHIHTTRQYIYSHVCISFYIANKELEMLFCNHKSYCSVLIASLWHLSCFRRSSYSCYSTGASACAAVITIMASVFVERRAATARHDITIKVTAPAIL